MNLGISRFDEIWCNRCQNNKLAVKWLSICIFCFIMTIPVCSTGCAGNNNVQPAVSMTINLMDKFTPVDPDPSSTQFHQSLLVIRNGDRRDALAVVAPVTIHAQLKNVSKQMTLEGFAAPMFNMGDGFRMNVFLERDGQRQLIGSRYFDPGRNADHRKWMPIRMTLTPEENDQLEIQVTTGPQNDSVADWLALSSLRLTADK